jgi:hypothetical protein
MVERDNWQTPISTFAAASGVAWPRAQASAAHDPADALLDPLESDDAAAGRHAVPTSPLFWIRHAPGQRVLLSVAAAHAVLAVGGAAAAALVFYRSSWSDLSSALAGAAAIAVVLASVLALVYGRSARPGAVLVVRSLLPLVDLLACSTLLWLIGERSFTTLLFLIPAVAASVLLSWRSGAIYAALAETAYAGISSMRLGTTDLATWAPTTLALGGALLLLTVCFAAYSLQLGGLAGGMAEQARQLSGDRDTQAEEQRRLLEGLNLLEEAQARLERERVLVNQQIADLAAAAQRLSDGDPTAVHALRPGMYGPLDVLAGALHRLTSQMSATLTLAQRLRTQQQTVEALAAGLRDQGILLGATDTALRDLGTRGNELVAEVQALEQSAGSVSGTHDLRLASGLRRIEQSAMTQASNTAMLGSRLAQLSARQSSLEAELRRLSHALADQGSGSLR